MADFELALSMMTLVRTKATGVLEVAKAERRAEIEWSAGRPVFATEHGHGESLGRLLVRQRQLSTVQYEATIQRMAERTASEREAFFGDTVVELGFLDSAQVQKALLDQLRWRIVRCLQLEDPTSKFIPSTDPPDASAYPFDVEPLILLALRWVEPTRAEAFLLPHLSHVPRVTASVAAVTSVLRLEAEEAALVTLVDGVRSVQSVVAAAGGSPEARAVMSALLLTGLCTTAVPLADRLTAGSPLAPGDVAARAPRPGSGEHGDVQAQPSGPVLKRMASSRAFAQRLAPRGLGKQMSTASGLGRSPGTAAAASSGASAGAVGVKAGPVGAAPLHVPTPHKIDGASGERRDPSQKAKQDPRLAAEQAFQTGKKLLHADDLERALVEFQRAASLMGASAEYRLYAQWIEWLGGKTEAEHASALGATAREAAVDDPNLAFPRYVLGRLALATGDVKHAKLLFKFAVKLDPSLLDAQRYLRLIELRKGAAFPADAPELFQQRPQQAPAKGGGEGAGRPGSQPDITESEAGVAAERAASDPKGPCVATSVKPGEVGAAEPPRGKDSGARVAASSVRQATPGTPLAVQPSPAGAARAEPPKEGKASELVDAMLDAIGPPPAVSPSAPDAPGVHAHGQPPADGGTKAGAREARGQGARRSGAWVPLVAFLGGGGLAGGGVFFLMSSIHGGLAPSLPMATAPAPHPGPSVAGTPATPAISASAASSSTSRVSSSSVAPAAATSASASSAPAPAPSASARADAVPSAAVAPALSAGSSSGSGMLVIPPSAGSHRVWVDGKLVGQSPLELRTTCGPHTVQIGGGSKMTTMDVPCDSP